MTDRDELKCPHCGGALRDRDGLAGLSQDAHGFFVNCRHCKKRVALEDISLPGGPRAFRVAGSGGR